MKHIYDLTFYIFGGWFTFVASGVGGYIALAGGTAAGAYLSRPKAAGAVGYQNVNLQDEQSKSIAGNIANQPDIEALIASSNKFNQGQANSLMEQAIPGWGKLSSSLATTSVNELQNPYNLPPDVQKNLERISAEKGISAGARGQFNDFSLLRDLGVNQLQYGQQRIGQAQNIYQTLGQMAPRVNPLSPMSFFVTPQEQVQNTTNNNTTNQQIGQSAANANQAAANYANQNMWSSLTQMTGTLAGSGYFNQNPTPNYAPTNQTVTGAPVTISHSLI